MVSFGKTTSVPIFDGENYDYWSIQMKTFFLSQDLWDVVEKGVAIPPEGVSNSAQHKQESNKDARALFTLQQAVSEFILPRVIWANTSKRAWEILQSEFQRNAKALMTNPPAIRFTNQEQLDDYVVAIDMAECCIYRVPKRLREVNPMAYTPRLVSIGPFHYSLRKELKEMERQKHRYLRDFLTRNTNNNIMGELVRIIQDNEVSIRRCYSESFLLSSEEFVNIILLDAMFILELFWGIFNKSTAEKKKDYILSQPIMESGIMHDLLLLENQLPFFVLVKLYSCCYQRNETGNILLKQSCNFFRAIFCNGQAAEPKIDEVKHFSDLLRSIFLPPKPSNNEIDNENKCTARYSATKLDEAGLKFRPTSGGSLTEIKMSENCCLEKFPFFNLSWLLACLPCLKYSCLTRMQRFLKIPHLRVDDNTEGLFRNLMAFEQCHYPSEPYICEYVVLLDDLITTDADVSLLVDKEIIDNLLGSSTAVTTLFNRLALEIQVPERSHYGKLYKDLGKYCDSVWNRLVGTLTRVYFTDVFKGTATVVGMIVLVFTLWNFFR